MTINPPKIVIDKNEPFKGALFDREEFGESLVNILRKISDNLVVFVDAPWGAGKTTFAKMWLAHLREQQKLEVIYYDAYAADYFDDPFVSFSGEILSLSKRLAGETGLIHNDEFKKSAVEVGKRIAGLAAKIGLRAATLNVIEAAHIKDFKELASEIAAGVSEAGSAIIEKKIEDYSKEKDALDDFKTKLKKLAAEIREKQGFPLTIIVDELDRCRPDFAVGLLERIKHLFDVEGVAFVLLVNREQIENYICGVYGDKVDARSYLLKFGNLFVDLPNREARFSYEYKPGRVEFCQNLIGHYGLSKRARDSKFLGTCVGVFADHFDLTLREVEKAFAILAVYYGSTPSQHITDPHLVALLSVVKIKKPALYRSLAGGKISAAQFYEQSHFKNMEIRSGEEFNLAWAIDMLDYGLMSDEEFANATSSSNPPEKVRNGLNQMFQFFGRARTKIIPSLCWHLDRFALQP